MPPIVSDDPAGVLMRRLIDSFAEYERALIAAGTRGALAAKRARGERISRYAPYGSRFVGDRIDAEPAEQAILRIVQEQRAAGVSLQGIADHLNARGLRTRSGSPWRFQYVQAILRRYRPAA